MKQSDRNEILVALIASAVLLCGVVEAQDRQRVRSLTLAGKDVTTKSDGLEIKILKESGGNWLMAGQNEEFKSGDKVRVQFWSNINGHIYFVNINPSAKQRVIFHQVIQKDRDYTLPGRDGSKEMWIEFDNEKGTEILKLVMSPTSIKVFEEALTNSEGALGESVFSVSNELAGGNKPPATADFVPVAMIQAQGSKSGGCPPGVVCRSLGFDPPNSATGKGAVIVASPDSKNPTGKLDNNEAIIVELRLKHI